ncbi:MAG: bifunctional 4-hydroxy-2-oxoglutarate aldolase/2-dehydro-3-deoxy-phosphogluconate aldolase [Oscillospiraceae bacterium]|nr:bifunctional 4-hydroxy-2-oxoglutarate aldolase/2-dehydro-3-deoxy-phosphogluconate aldolase [Oscillospiraceae bacterium]
MREHTIQAVLDNKLVAIVRGLGEEQIIPLAQALGQGGIKMIEVTFNQSDPDSFATTANAIRALVKEGVSAGAGTVCTRAQLDMAAEAGAQYIITPVTNPTLITEVRKMGLVSIPGALTPTECMIAHEAGADFIKLFPMGSLGVDYLKAIRAPLNHLKFLAVGGVNERNLKDFLAVGAVGFGVGGNLVNKDWVEAGEFDKITALAKKYVEGLG